MAAAAAAVIIKYGPDIYEFLGKMNDTTVTMKCQFPTDDPSSNTIVFEAFDARPFMVQAAAETYHRVPAWGIEEARVHTAINTPFGILPNYFGFGGVQETVQEPNRFGTIEIECNNKKEFRHLMDDYRRMDVIPQSDIIQYLKLIRNRYVKISKMEVSKLRTESGVSQGFVLQDGIIWGVWKLRCVID